jgi:hypothetical protein
MDPKEIVDPLDQPVWGTAKIGEVIGRSETKTSYLLNRGLLDASKIGDRWVSTPRRLLASLAAGRSAP